MFMSDSVIKLFLGLSRLYKRTKVLECPGCKFMNKKTHQVKIDYSKKIKITYIDDVLNFLKPYRIAVGNIIL